MIRDLRYSLRTLVKSPGFTIVAVLTLALGIAANSAIFSAVDAVLLHPLRFPHPEQLVNITKTMPMFQLFKGSASPLDFTDFRAQNQAFSDMAAIGHGQYNLTGDRLPERVPGMRISPSLFRLLGVTPILGRAFLSEEEQYDRRHEVILSEPFWRSHFGADRQALGKQIELDGEKYAIVGVVRPVFAFLGNADLLLPLAFAPDDLASDNRGRQFLEVVARIKTGASMPQARADLQRVANQLTQQYATWYPKGWTLEANLLADKISGPIRTPLLVLLGAVALVLLIACANVANLLLARASQRQKEITIRVALGARRTAIVRQLLMESSIIAVAAGATGLLASAWILDSFERFGPTGLLRGQHLAADSFVTAFTLLLSFLATLVFGLAPAISASKADLNDALKETTRGASGGAGRQRTRSVLIAAEVALSLTLLVSAGLLIRSFLLLEQSNPGFDSGQLATFQISLPIVQYRQPAQLSVFYDELLARLSSFPGVTVAGAIDPLPFSGSNRGGSFNIVGRKWGDVKPDVAYHRASGGYFRAMRIPLLRGRLFDEHDTFDAPKVAVVDDPFVKQFFQHEDPLGKQLTDGFSGPGSSDAFTIVGVVGGIRNNQLTEPPAPTIYYCGSQAAYRAISIVMRAASGDPLRLIAPVRRTVAAMDHNLPIYRPATMEQRLSDSLTRTRFSTTLLSAFAALALILAAIGIYGVIAFIVGQRSHEIGIRMALGARPRDAVLLVLRQGSTPVLVGIIAGFVASLAATRALSSLLYGVSTADPLTYATVALFLALVALAAGYIPARKATKVDPMIALRYE